MAKRKNVLPTNNVLACFTVKHLPFGKVTTPSSVNTCGIWKKTFKFSFKTLLKQSSKSRGGFWNMHPRTTPPLTGATYASVFYYLQAWFSLFEQTERLISSCRHAGKYALKNFTPQVLFFFVKGGREERPWERGWTSTGLEPVTSRYRNLDWVKYIRYEQSTSCGVKLVIVVIFIS